VLSTPPAFILSQDQTLQFKSCACPSRYSPTGSLFEIYSQLSNLTQTTLNPKAKDHPAKPRARK
jgi:hypothetical protein